MLNRQLEPEVMDTKEDVHDYNAMNHSVVNIIFVDDLIDCLKQLEIQNAAQNTWKILDVGTGTGLIPIELCLRGAEYHVVACDLSLEMLKLAERNLLQADHSEHTVRSGFPVSRQISLQHADSKRLPFKDDSFDVVISNSLIHHIPEPLCVFQETWRVLRRGGLWFMRDLFRPSDLVTLNHLVQTYAGLETNCQQQLFRQSLHAALTVEEVSQILQSMQLPTEWIQATSDRHWTLIGMKPDSD